MNHHHEYNHHHLFFHCAMICGSLRMNCANSVIRPSSKILLQPAKYTKEVNFLGYHISISFKPFFLVNELCEIAYKATDNADNWIWKQRS